MWNYCKEMDSSYKCTTYSGLFLFFFGTVRGIDLVWHFVDMVITFMTILNLITLLLLTGVVVKETRDYFDAMKTLDWERKVPKVS